MSWGFGLTSLKVILLLFATSGVYWALLAKEFVLGGFGGVAVLVGWGSTIAWFRANDVNSAAQQEFFKSELQKLGLAAIVLIFAGGGIQYATNFLAEGEAVSSLTLAKWIWYVGIPLTIFFLDYQEK